MAEVPSNSRSWHSAAERSFSCAITFVFKAQFKQLPAAIVAEGKYRLILI